MSSGESKENWQEIVDAWRASGLSKAEFCKKQKIVVSAFYYWCRKMENGQSKNPPKLKSRPKPKRRPVAREKPIVKEKTADDKPAFVEISIPNSDNASHGAGQVFRITTSYGAVMEIPL